MSDRSMSPDLSVIIVNWNTRDLLRDCLRSFYARDYGLTTEVWVVDNASGDGSREMVSREFPQVRLIANKENLGYGKANNQAMSASTGRSVLLLNSDTVVSDGVIEETYRRLAELPELGAVGCALVGVDGETQPSFGLSFPSGPTVSSGEEIAPGVLKCAYVWGAYLMVKREVIDAVGGLDEDFFMFYEEIDWCWRMIEAGWMVGYCPERSITHINRGSCRAVGEGKVSRWVVTGECLLYTKHHGTNEFASWRRSRMLHHGWCALSYRLRGLFSSRAKIRQSAERHQAALEAFRAFRQPEGRPQA